MRSRSSAESPSFEHSTNEDKRQLGLERQEILESRAMLMCPWRCEIAGDSSQIDGNEGFGGDVIG